MEKEIKQKLGDICELMNDPDATVMDKEVKEKLEKILALLNNPEGIVMEKVKLKERMEEIEGLVNNAMVDVEVDVEYCMPEGEGTSESCDVSGNPYILLTYTEDEYNTRTRKVSLGNTALQSTPEDLTKHVLLAIAEFKDEMDDIKMG
jgi:hypothetical protein